DAVHRHGVDENLLASPVEPPPLTGVSHLLVAPDDEQTAKLDVPGPETVLNVLRLSHVVQFVKPIDDLAEPVLEVRCPFRRRFLPLLAEDAAGRTVLPLDEHVGLADGVARHHVTTEVAKQLILEGEQLKVRHTPEIRPEEDSQLLVRFKERLDVCVFLEFRLGSEQRGELLQFLPAADRIKRDAEKVFHSTLAGSDLGAL